MKESKSFNLDFLSLFSFLLRISERISNTLLLFLCGRGWRRRRRAHLRLGRRPRPRRPHVGGQATPSSPTSSPFLLWRRDGRGRGGDGRGAVAETRYVRNIQRNLNKNSQPTILFFPQEASSATPRSTPWTRSPLPPPGRVPPCATPRPPSPRPTSAASPSACSPSSGGLSPSSPRGSWPPWGSSTPAAGTASDASSAGEFPYLAPACLG